MVKTVKKSRLAGVPAWALACLTFVATIGIFELLEHIPIPDSLKSIDAVDIELIIVVIIYAIFLSIACFLICKTYPKSVWYTPLICNALIIFIVIMDQEYWIFMISIIALSVIGAIVGARIGRSRINQAK